MTTIPEILERIREVEGITNVYLNLEVTVTHKKRNTGEYDRVGNPIREQVASDKELAEVAEDIDGLNHFGTIDVPSDYRVKDRYTFDTDVKIEQ